MTDPAAPRSAWAFASNMYPSLDDVSYGTFVKRSHDDLVAEGFRIGRMAVIAGRLPALKKAWAYLRHYGKLLGILMDRQVPCLYLHYASHHCLLPAIGARWFNKRVVVHIHGDDLSLNSGFYRRLAMTGQSLLLRHARAVVVPSPHSKQLVQARHPLVEPTRIIVSPSGGVALDALRAATACRPTYWERVAAGEAPIADVGYVGRIDADKGWEQLVRAYAALPDAAQKRLRIQFWGDGKEASKLRRLIEMNPTWQVQYNGPAAEHDVPTVHGGFDLHAIPSERESLGLSAIEGLAAGHVVLCSRIVPFTTITQDGHSALHFEASHVPSLTAALQRVLTLPPTTLHTIASNGRLAAAPYDKKVVSAALAAAIKECTDE